MKINRNKSINGFSIKELINLSMERPALAQLELTRNCNQRCLFCFSACSSRKKFRDLSLEDWIKILDKLFELGVSKLNLSGGEILLYKNLEKLLYEIKKRHFYVVLNTNGTISLKNYIEYIDLVVFSIHGIEERHEGVTNLKGSFSLALRHLDEVVGETDVAINTVLVKDNFSDIEDIYLYFNKKYPSLDHHSFTFAVNSFNGRGLQKHELELEKRALDYYMKCIDKIPENKRLFKHGMQALISKDYCEDKEKIVRLPDCAGGKYKIVITYDGSVYPCNFFLNKDFYCGNILKEDPMKIWKYGKGFKPFRDYYNNSKVDVFCKKCNKLERCLGGCRAYTRSYLLNGKFSNERDQRCIIRPSFARTRNNN